MQSFPQGVDIYVHRLIHESLMKQVMSEYCLKCHLDPKYLRWAIENSSTYIRCLVCKFGVGTVRPDIVIPIRYQVSKGKIKK